MSGPESSSERSPGSSRCHARFLELLGGISTEYKNLLAENDTLSSENSALQMRLRFAEEPVFNGVGQSCEDEGVLKTSEDRPCVIGRGLPEPLAAQDPPAELKRSEQCHVLPAWSKTSGQSGLSRQSRLPQMPPQSRRISDPLPAPVVTKAESWGGCCSRSCHRDRESASDLDLRKDAEMNVPISTKQSIRGATTSAASYSYGRSRCSRGSDRGVDRQAFLDFTVQVRHDMAMAIAKSEEQMCRMIRDSMKAQCQDLKETIRHTVQVQDFDLSMAVKSLLTDMDNPDAYPVDATYTPGSQSNQDHTVIDQDNQKVDQVLSVCSMQAPKRTNEEFTDKRARFPTSCRSTIRGSLFAGLYESLEKHARSTQFSEVSTDGVGHTTTMAHAVDPLMRFIRTRTFDFMSSFLVVGNMLCLGFETQSFSKGTTTEEQLSLVWLCLNIAFAVELVLRLLAYKRRFFYNHDWKWNWMDLILVCLSVTEFLVGRIKEKSNANTEYKQTLHYARIIRVIRSVRLARVLRKLKGFHSMVILISASLRTLVSLVVLMSLLIYSFGVLFTNAATDWRHKNKSTDDYKLVDDTYGSLSSSMYTLFQAMSNGISWSAAAEPLQRIDRIWLWFFLMYITFTTFCVLNVVTSVFLETAMLTSKQEAEFLMCEHQSERSLKIKHLKEIFRMADQDTSHEISWPELKAIIKAKPFRDYLGAIGIDMSSVYQDDDVNMRELRLFWKLLDIDESGKVSRQEFFESCLKLQGHAKSFDVHILRHETKSLKKAMTDLMKVLAVNHLSTKSKNTFPGKITLKQSEEQ